MNVFWIRSWRLWAVLAALLALVVLTACGANPGSTAGQPAASPTEPAAGVSEPAANTPAALTREDSQGAVTVQVTPLNLEQPAATLDFDVVMDTHSVDLSMDLTQLATLQSDTGIEVQANAWPVGSGHHYEGTLSFPTLTAAGQNLLEGATRLTLVIKNLDAPERVFEWELP
ncbi:MAG: hypothetical protein AB1791_01345 [Chloroflexota bacterium]